MTNSTHPKNTITTRPATWQDRATILRLVLDMGSHDDVAGNVDPMRWLGALLRASEARVIVAEGPCGEVVGFAEVQARSSTIGDVREAWLGALAVAPQERGRGIGGALLAAVDEAARELGCSRIEVESSSWREATHGFYRAHGYGARPPAERFERRVPGAPSRDVIPQFLAAAALAASAVQSAIVDLGARDAVGLGADGAPTEAADRAAEDAVLAALLPLGLPIVSEECGLAAAPGDDGGLWIALDPLDGSRNFRAGYPPYATAMGLLRGSVPVAGFVCELTSMRRWWSDGAQAFADGRAIRTSRGPFVGYPSPARDQPITVTAALEHRVRISGSTVTDLCHVADGSLAAFVATSRRVVHVHDLAGPMAIVAAAGGVVFDATTGAAPLLVRDPKATYAVIAAADIELARTIAASPVVA